MNGLDIKKIRKNIGKTQLELGRMLGVSKSTIVMWEQEKRNPSVKNALKIKELQHKHKKSQEELLNKDELEPKEYNGKTKVTVVSSNAQAGWSDNYYSDEYIKDMPTILIESDENYKGNYLAFEVKGESMEPEYYEGDIVICREVRRDYWGSKLHYKDWDFVIAHGTQGLMLKEIISHNIDNGEIMCHSLHEAHDDFSLNLKEVAFLYNVVEHRQKGRNKRRFR